MQPSERVSDLYSTMYAGGVERAARDAGAVDKADNIVRAWRSAALPDHPRIVELGCGEGAVAAALTQRGFPGGYDAYDVSASGIAEARQRGIPGVTFSVTGGGSLPVVDDGADLVVLSHVVEHLEHPRSLIYEARRLAPYVVIEVPLELNVRLPRDYVWDDLGHINKYTATSIRQLVQTCDLEIVGQFTTNPSQAHALFYVNTRKRRLEWNLKQRGLAVAPRLSRSLFTYHETILARRPRRDHTT